MQVAAHSGAHLLLITFNLAHNSGGAKSSPRAPDPGSGGGRLQLLGDPLSAPPREGPALETATLRGPTRPRPCQAPRKPPGLRTRDLGPSPGSLQDLPSSLHRGNAVSSADSGQHNC
ncbi:uncharacterized protein AAES06_001457 isoform 1-T2 [Glossophaga mutica]